MSGQEARQLQSWDPTYRYTHSRALVCALDHTGRPHKGVGFLRRLDPNLEGAAAARDP